MILKELLNHNRTEIENYSRGFAKSFMMGDKMCTRMLGGPLMFCDPTNFDFSPWLGLEGFWESWVTMAIGRAIQPGSICYDVGAAWGYYSLLMGWAEAKQVVAIEPIPTRAEYARLNMKVSYRTTPFEVVECTVGNGTKMTMPVAVLPSIVKGMPTEGDFEFRARSFDEICKEKSGGKVDFMKVDIDGGELLFWDGVQETIKNNPNLIMVVEVNSQRYDATAFYTKINKVYETLRVVTTDGGVSAITVNDLVRSSKDDQMLWLQH